MKICNYRALKFSMLLQYIPTFLSLSSFYLLFPAIFPISLSLLHFFGEGKRIEFC